MSKKKTIKKSNERIDEPKFDWAEFEETFWKNYQDALKKGIPPELEGDTIAEDFETLLCK